MNEAVPQNATVVAKFGGTSVADFDAMSRSADVVLSNPDLCLTVLSASPGIANLLVALAAGCETEKRTYQLFVEILRNRKVQLEWFDVLKVMRSDDRFGRATPDSVALTELAQTLLQPRLQEALVITRALSAASPKASPSRAAVVTIHD